MISLRKTWMILTILGTGITYGFSQDHWEIIRTIESDNIESFQKKMEAIEDINMTLANGYTMLNYSIMAGRVDIAEYLLSKNADVEKVSNKQSPLMLSARYNTNILKLLIARGAEINREVNGKTAVIAALEEYNQNSIDILKEEGATVEMRGGVDGPYIFYDTLLNVTTLIAVNENNEIQVDTLKNPPGEIIVQTPLNGSFKVQLKKPVPETKSIFKKTDKIFAMSDIEGNFTDFLQSLISNKIIDNEFNWAFGNGHLVLLGDFVDRGKYVTQVLWLIYKLEQEAFKAGGKVHYLLGNHEAMNLMEDYRFVNIRYKILAYQTGIEFRDFNSDQTEFGAWLRTKNVVEKIGKNLFVHAGISDSLLLMNYSIPRINKIARNAFSIPQSMINQEANLILFDYGVLWYRGYISEENEYPKISYNSVDNILASYGADRLFVGHTIVGDISIDYDGKIVRLDVDHYKNIACGILITGNKIYKAKKNGQTELLHDSR